jgi:AraC-like DNA-binding protein
MAQLRGDLVSSPAGCWQFFSSLFELAHQATTVTTLATSMDVLPSTLMSRFFRARLPPPKRYLAMARLTCAAYLFENAGLSLSTVSHQLDYSSPQGFGRHVRALLRISAAEFRENYDGDGMLQHFRSELVLPFLTTLRMFDPIRG